MADILPRWRNNPIRRLRNGATTASQVETNVRPTSSQITTVPPQRTSPLQSMAKPFPPYNFCKKGASPPLAKPTPYRDSHPRGQKTSGFRQPVRDRVLRSEIEMHRRKMKRRCWSRFMALSGTKDGRIETLGRWEKARGRGRGREESGFGGFLGK